MSLLRSGSSGALPGRCTGCGRMVEFGGTVCARCTARRGGQTVFLVVVLGVGALLTRHWSQTPGTQRSAVVEDPDATHVAVPAVPKAGMAGWVYFDVDDPLVHDTAHHARLLGDPPGADGPAGPGTLELTSSAHYGKRAIISFPRVKAACDANPCTLRLAFERPVVVAPAAAPAMAVGAARGVVPAVAQAAAVAVPPAADSVSADAYAFHDISDDDKTILQLDDFDSVLQQLTGARRMTVVAQFGMTHDYVLSFPVDGFSVGRMREGK